MRKIDKSRTIFNGEMVVSRSGVYTFAHFYGHPVTNRKVVLCGMYHIGQREYYDKVKNILNECEIVLYEPIDYFPRHKYKKFVDESIYEAIGLDELLTEVLMGYFLYIENSIGSKFGYEGKEFKQFYFRKNWVHADLLPDLCDNSFDDYPSIRLYKDKLIYKLKKIPSRKKRRLLEGLLHDITLMREGIFTARDFGRNLLMMDSHEYLLNIFAGMFAKERDNKCFEVFDDTIDSLNPHTVGIKFGIGHMPNQRKLLERRGYEYLRSKKICLVHF